MGDNIYLPDRNGVRTPMQWDETKPHSGWFVDNLRSIYIPGFSRANKIYSPIVQSTEYGPDRVNVLDAIKDPSSFYNILKHMIAARRKHPCFGWGRLQWLPVYQKSIAAWVRYHGEDKVLVVSNLSGQKVNAIVKLPLKLLPLREFLVEVLTGRRYYLQKTSNLVLEMDPYQFLWMDLRAY